MFDIVAGMEGGKEEEGEGEEGREGKFDEGLAEDEEEEEGGREGRQWKGGVKGCSSRTRRRTTRADSI